LYASAGLSKANVPVLHENLEILSRNATVAIDAGSEMSSAKLGETGKNVLAASSLVLLLSATDWNRSSGAGWLATFRVGLPPHASACPMEIPPTGGSFRHSG